MQNKVCLPLCTTVIFPMAVARSETNCGSGWTLGGISLHNTDFTNLKKNKHLES